MNSFVVSSLAALAAATGTGDINFASVSKFDISEPAFIRMESYEDAGDDFLLISQFSGSPMSHGSVSVVTGIKDAVNAGDVSGLSPTKLDTTHF